MSKRFQRMKKRRKRKMPFSRVSSKKKIKLRMLQEMRKDAYLRCMANYVSKTENKGAFN